MWHNLSKKQRVLAVIGGLLLVGGLTSIYLLLSSRPKDPSGTGQFFDDRSGETISNPDGKAPDKFGAEDSDKPIYLGFSKLLEIMSKFQLETTKDAFYAFSRSGNRGYKELSIAIDSIRVIQHTPGTDERDFVIFNVTADRKTTYRARLEYFDISYVRLVLTDPDGKEVYNSGDVGDTAD